MPGPSPFVLYVGPNGVEYCDDDNVNGDGRTYAAIDQRDPARSYVVPGDSDRSNGANGKPGGGYERIDRTGLTMCSGAWGKSETNDCDGGETHYP